MSSRPVEDEREAMSRGRLWFEWGLRSFAFVFVLVGQVPKLTSGDAFRVTTGVLVVAFLVTMFTVGRPRRHRRTPSSDPGALRRSARAGLLVFGPWLVIVVAWLAWGFATHRLSPVSLGAVVLPLLIVGASAFMYLRADQLGARVAAQQAERT